MIYFDIKLYVLNIVKNLIFILFLVKVGNIKIEIERNVLYIEYMKIYFIWKFMNKNLVCVY